MKTGATTLSATGFVTDATEGAREGVATAVLADGRILFAGGCNITSAGPNLYFTVAKIYDPATDRLKGVYFQAVAKQRYEIYFERQKP